MAVSSNKYDYISLIFLILSILFVTVGIYFSYVVYLMFTGGPYEHFVIIFYIAIFGLGAIFLFSLSIVFLFVYTSRRKNK